MEHELEPDPAHPLRPDDPDVAADHECAGDVEQYIGDPVDDDEVDVAIDAFLAEDEDDLDGDGQPDPPAEAEEAP
jgi:hypothetical protein